MLRTMDHKHNDVAVVLLSKRLQTHPSTQHVDNAMLPAITCQKQLLSMLYKSPACLVKTPLRKAGNLPASQFTCTPHCARLQHRYISTHSDATTFCTTQQLLTEWPVVLQVSYKPLTLQSQPLPLGSAASGTQKCWLAAPTINPSCHLTVA